MGDFSNKVSMALHRLHASLPVFSLEAGKFFFFLLVLEVVVGCENSSICSSDST